MARETPASPAPVPISRDRLWAEQLAMGMAVLVGVLIFMACFHEDLLSSGAKVFGPNYLAAYGWASAVGIFLQFVVHEGGTLLVAKWLKVPIRFRFFAFGANATAMLENQPRRPWTDAVIGFAGPMTGSLVSVFLALGYRLSYNPDDPHSVGPFFLGMACVGYFYNLFTLIPILDLEGGWIAPAVAPQAWLFGIILSVLVLTHQGFNLVLLAVVSFALPRLILLIRARAPQEDLVCTTRQRLIVSIGYFVVVLILAWLSSTTFDQLPALVTDAMSD